MINDNPMHNSLIREKHKKIMQMKFKNKKYEERYGEEKAKEIKRKIGISSSGIIRKPRSEITKILAREKFRKTLELHGGRKRENNSNYRGGRDRFEHICKNCNITFKGAQHKTFCSDKCYSEFVSKNMKIKNPMKNKEVAKKVGIKISKIFSLKSPQEKSDIIKKGITKRRQIKKTHPEIKLEKIINELKLPYKYCGSGKGMCFLNGQIPDFIDINGDKKVIDVNGCYWHLKYRKPKRWTKELEEQKRRQRYEEIGFKYLVIWDDESDEQITNKLLEFI